MLYHHLQSHIKRPRPKLYLALIPGLLLASTNLFAASPADPHFAVSGACRNCHDNIYDADSNDVSIGNDWEAGMMANASRDPYWIAKVAAEINRNPHLGDLLNDTCSRCHAPMANDAAKKEEDPVQLFGSGFLSDQNDYHEYAIDGVSCTVCHQITDDDLGTLDGFSGNFKIEEHDIPALRPAYGQFTAPLSGGMVNQSQFTPVFSTHIQDSSLCATCHNLKTPFVDADGNPASTTP